MDAEQHVLGCFIFFPAFLLSHVFRSLRFLGVYPRLLLKKLHIEQAILEASFMLYGQFHEREFLSSDLLAGMMFFFSNEFKNACVFSQLVIQLINRNRLEITN